MILGKNILIINYEIKLQGGKVRQITIYEYKSSRGGTVICNASNDY